MVEVSEKSLKTLVNFGSIALGEAAFGVDGGDTLYLNIAGKYINVTNESGDLIFDLNPDMLEAILELFKITTNVNE